LGAGIPPPGAPPPRLPLPPPTAVSTEPTTVGKPLWRSRTPHRRGASIGASGRAHRQGDLTTPSPWRRP
jgi:hypothetical protein